MKVIVNFQHTRSDPWLETQARKQVKKIERLLKNYSDTLVLHIDFTDPTNTTKRTVFDRGVALRMTLPKGRVIHIEEVDDTFVKAINFAIDRFVRQLKRWLSRQNPTKTQKHLVPGKLIRLP